MGLPAGRRGHGRDRRARGRFQKAKNARLFRFALAFRLDDDAFERGQLARGFLALRGARRQVSSGVGIS